MTKIALLSAILYPKKVQSDSEKGWGTHSGHGSMKMMDTLSHPHHKELGYPCPSSATNKHLCTTLVCTFSCTYFSLRRERHAVLLWTSVFLT